MISLEKQVVLAKTASLVNDNLSCVSSLSGSSRVFRCAALHKGVVCLASFDDHQVNSRVQATTRKDSHSLSIHQTRWLSLLQPRPVFVVALDRGFDVYEDDAESLIYSHQFTGSDLDDQRGGVLDIVIASRCIGYILPNYLLIGRSDGCIFVYVVPPKGSSVVLVDRPERKHSGSVTSMATSSDSQFVASADDTGSVIIWSVVASKLRIRCKQDVGDGKPIISVGFWKDYLIVGLQSGTVFVLSSQELEILVEITAHFRALTSMDVADLPLLGIGLIATASEDTYYRLFVLRDSEDRGGIPAVEQYASSTLPHRLICGIRLLVSSLSPTDDLRVALTGYESNKISVYKVKMDKV